MAGKTKDQVHVISIAQLGLLTAVLLCGAACTKLFEAALPWLGVRSTTTLGFEEALTLTVDTAHNGRALIGAATIAEAAKRAIKALRQRHEADEKLRELITPLLKQIHEELER